MVYSGWGAQEIYDTGDNHASRKERKVKINEPRFNRDRRRNHIRFQQGKHDDEENAGEHMCNKLCHTLKIIQFKNVSCKKTAKRKLYWILRGKPLRMTKKRSIRMTETLQPTPHTQPPTTHILQSTSYFLLPTAYFLLPTNYYLSTRINL